MSECGRNTYLQIHCIHLQPPKPGTGLEAVGGDHHTTLPRPHEVTKLLERDQPNLEEHIAIVGCNPVLQLPRCQVIEPGPALPTSAHSEQRLDCGGMGC